MRRKPGGQRKSWAVVPAPWGVLELEWLFRVVLTLAEMVRPLNPVYLSHYMLATLGKWPLQLKLFLHRPAAPLASTAQRPYWRVGWGVLLQYLSASFYYCHWSSASILRHDTAFELRSNLVAVLIWYWNHRISEPKEAIEIILAALLFHRRKSEVIKEGRGNLNVLPPDMVPETKIWVGKFIWKFLPRSVIREVGKGDWKRKKLIKGVFQMMQTARAQALQGPPGISPHNSELSYAEGKERGTLPTHPDWGLFLGGVNLPALSPHFVRGAQPAPRARIKATGIQESCLQHVEVNHWGKGLRGMAAPASGDCPNLELRYSD